MIPDLRSYATARHDLRSVVPNRRLFFLTIASESGLIRYVVVDEIFRSYEPTVSLELVGAPYDHRSGQTVHEYLRDQVLAIHDRAVKGLEGTGLDPVSEMYKAAVHALKDMPYPIGTIGPDGEHSPIWTPPGTAPPARRRMTRMQDAMTYALMGFDEEAYAEWWPSALPDRPQLVPSMTKEPRVVRVENYTEAPEYFDQDDARALVAEYIYTFRSDDGEAIERLRQSKSARYFLLPLRGLGQYRSCAAWLEFVVDEEKKSEAAADIEQRVTRSLKRSAETHISRSLIEAFGRELFDAVATYARRHRVPGDRTEAKPRRDSRDLNSPPELVQRAFASLWHADEIWFRDGGRLIGHFVRSEDHTLRQNVGPTTDLKEIVVDLPGDYQKLAGREHILAMGDVEGDGWTTTAVVRLDRVDGWNAALAVQTFGFDEVIFRIPFERLPEPIEGTRFSKRRRWADQQRLWARQLSEVLSKDILRPKREASSLAESVAESLTHTRYNQISRATGIVGDETIADALSTLSDSGDHEDALQNVIVEALALKRYAQSLLGEPWLVRHFLKGKPEVDKVWSDRRPTPADANYWLDQLRVDAYALLGRANPNRLNDVICEINVWFDGERLDGARIREGADPTELIGLMESVSIERFKNINKRRAPWPMRDNVDDGISGQGPTSLVLTLPRELLRNAVTHVREGIQSPKPQESRRFGDGERLTVVSVEALVDSGRRSIDYTVKNALQRSRSPDDPIQSLSIQRDARVAPDVLLLRATKRVTDGRGDDWAIAGGEARFATPYAIQP